MYTSPSLASVPHTVDINSYGKKINQITRVHRTTTVTIYSYNHTVGLYKRKPQNKASYTVEGTVDLVLFANLFLR